MYTARTRFDTTWDNILVWWILLYARRRLGRKRGEPNAIGISLNFARRRRLCLFFFFERGAGFLPWSIESYALPKEPRNNALCRYAVIRNSFSGQTNLVISFVWPPFLKYYVAFPSYVHSNSEVYFVIGYLFTLYYYDVLTPTNYTYSNFNF